LKRPFDDQTQARIRLETEAIDAILAYCRDKSHSLIGSEVLAYENQRNPDAERRGFAQSLLALAAETVAHRPEITQRANDWRAAGVSLLDALHLATAEGAGAEVFVTADDRLRKQAARIPSTLRILSPLELFQELTS
jgi:predicted nucleic acid-binding protein